MVSEAANLTKAQVPGAGFHGGYGAGQFRSICQCESDVWYDLCSQRNLTRQFVRKGGTHHHFHSAMFRMNAEAQELLESPNMEPYRRLALAVAQKQDVQGAMAELAALPLEKRYLWRVFSALKWAFVDYGSLNIVADRKTLEREQLLKINDLVDHRPTQFCLLLSDLYGEEGMQRIMLNAIQNGKRVKSDAAGETQPLYAQAVRQICDE